MGEKKRGLFSRLKPEGTLRRLRALREIREILLIVLIFLPILFEIAIMARVADNWGLVDRIAGGGDKNVRVLNIDKQLNVKYVNAVMEKLDRFEEKGEIDHLLVVMNSPGGGAQASEELARYLKEYAKRVPTTLYVQSIAASGGYYIASGLKPIVASSNAIVGSIGVILPAVTAADLAKRVGVEEVAITVGKYKHPLSWFKKPTKEDIEYLKRNLLDPSFRNFASFVAKNRGMTMEQLAPYTQGKIFVASEVVGPLVDRISDLTTVKREIREKLQGGDESVRVAFLKIEPEKKRFPFLGADIRIAPLGEGGFRLQF